MSVPKSGSSLPKTGMAAGAAILIAAAALVSKWEGERFVPYPDPATGGAPWTVCYGHAGPDVIRGKRYTKAECDGLLQKDLEKARWHLHRCIPGEIPASVETAYISLIFNVGPGPVCLNGKATRTALLAKEWRLACAALDRYKYAAGRVMRGLVLRRADERKVCEAGL